jgi:hypothetical protein
MYDFVKTLKERLDVKICPCGNHSNKDGKFVPLKGFSDAGFCHSCGKMYPPEKSIFFENEQPRLTLIKQKPLAKTSFITYFSGKKVIDSLTNYDSNNFILWLHNQLGPVAVKKTLDLYPVGTSNHWPGATIFWTLDINVTPRRGSVMLYDENGHRVKNKNHSVHALSGISSEKPPECFFGEHLLNYYPNKTIGIVESAKTAIVANHFVPDFLWLSCNGASGLTREKFKVLSSKNVILYPDKDKIGAWQERAELLQDIADIKVSEITQQIKHDENGTDLADLLLE